MVTRSSEGSDDARGRQDGSFVVAPVAPEAVSVAELAYQSLRGAILGMDIYDPDADLRLDEQRLAAALGVSRTPVRQALARLQHEGLVRIMPRRGVLIVRKSAAEITEMIRAWAALESMAARLLCERASDDDIRSLRDLFSGFEGDELRLHLDEYSEANLALPPAHHRTRPLAGHHHAWSTACWCTCGRSADA